MWGQRWRQERGSNSVGPWGKRRWRARVGGDKGAIMAKTEGTRGWGRAAMRGGAWQGRWGSAWLGGDVAAVEREGKGMLGQGWLGAAMGRPRREEARRCSARGGKESCSWGKEGACEAMRGRYSQGRGVAATCFPTHGHYGFASHVPICKLNSATFFKI